MVETIPGLVNAIRMIHSISRFYNTSERMTSLFVKVSNQPLNGKEGGGVNICDTINGNESLVENFNFYFLTPESGVRK